MCVSEAFVDGFGVSVGRPVISIMKRYFVRSLNAFYSYFCELLKVAEIVPTRKLSMHLQLIIFMLELYVSLFVALFLSVFSQVLFFQ